MAVRMCGWVGGWVGVRVRVYACVRVCLRADIEMRLRAAMARAVRPACQAVPETSRRVDPSLPDAGGRRVGPAE
jgi:hypothetical protein